MRWFKKTVLLLPLLMFSWASAETIVVGGKKFTEGYILAEAMAQLLEAEGFDVQRKFGMAGMVAFEALKVKGVDVYPEYTGTITKNVLKDQNNLSQSQINERLQPYKAEILVTMGFNNTYALAVPGPMAEKYQLKKISDIGQRKLVAAFSHEFVNRVDGWPALSKTYGLNFKIKATEHSLSYQALNQGAATIMDVYSTDAKIKEFGFTVLEDDLKYFPEYKAVVLARQGISEKAKVALKKFADVVNNDEMIRYNAMAVLEKKPYAEVSKIMLLEKKLVKPAHFKESKLPYDVLLRLIGEHLYLTFIPILMATFVAIPLSVLLLRWTYLAQPVLTFVGLLQTIPSLALLVFMIWYFEAIGTVPAISALFLYSLLPILRNSYTALKNIDPVLVGAARGIGLYNREILFSVRLPLAVPVILSGIRTAAVINVGMATIAAFIGAGGLGDPIVTGLALNDTQLILQGAIPAAVLAIVLELGFEQIEKRLGPQL